MPLSGNIRLVYRCRYLDPADAGLHRHARGDPGFVAGLRLCLARLRAQQQPGEKGDLLYELDPTPFINKVEAAQIALEQAKLSNQQLDAQIAAARANLRTAQYTARNDKVTLDRYQRLSTMQNVSQSDLDKVRTTWQTSEQSVSALNAQIQNLLIQRGERDDKRNVTLQNTVMRWRRRS